MISSTAIHEAGHAVVGRKLGMLCGQASVVEDQDSSGHSITADPYAIAYHWERFGHFRDFDTVLRGRAMTFMAGREAECEILGECSGGDRDDAYQISLMLAEITGSEEEQARIEARLRRGARLVVRRHRDAIEKIAHTLVRQRTINSEDLDQLIPGPVRSPPEWMADIERLIKAGPEVGTRT